MPFNFFIVLPEILASLTFQPLVRHVFNNNVLYVVLAGGGCLVAAAVSVAFVQDGAEAKAVVPSKDGVQKPLSQSLSQEG
jgi:maltose/moltooligosaccharide transporter